jgi:hypothetical protein
MIDLSETAVPALPWTTVDPEPPADLVASATDLVVPRWRDVPRFLRSSRRISAQTMTADGAVGFTLHADLRRRRFCTVSVWRDSRALAAFVRQGAHGRAMRAGSVPIEPHATVRFPVRATDLPLRWPEVIARLDAAAPGWSSSGRHASTTEADTSTTP